MRQNGNRCNFHPRKDGDYSGFAFSEERYQTAFLQFGYHFRGKNAGVQRDAIPWFWVSNRGEKHPCWHTILLAKSSVLYLLRPPHFAEMHWKGAVPRQTDTFRRQQNRRILWTESYKRQRICHEQNPPVRV